jgi:hypothetical protein
MPAEPTLARQPDHIYPLCIFDVSHQGSGQGLGIVLRLPARVQHENVLRAGSLERPAHIQKQIDNKALKKLRWRAADAIKQ